MKLKSGRLHASSRWLKKAANVKKEYGRNSYTLFTILFIPWLSKIYINESINIIIILTVLDTSNSC